MDPVEATFRSNLAAVLFEMKEYEECVEVCNKAIEIGCLHNADSKLIAKIFNRAGNAQKKLGRLHAAKTAYEKALNFDFITPDYKRNLSEVETTVRCVEYSIPTTATPTSWSTPTTATFTTWSTPSTMPTVCSTTPTKPPSVISWPNHHPSDPPPGGSIDPGWW